MDPSFHGVCTMTATIPESFTPFLGSLTFTRPTPDAVPLVILWADEHEMLPSGESRINKSVALYQSDKVEVGLQGVRKKIIQILQSAEHEANEQIADAILGCVVKAAQSGEKRADFLRDVLNRFRRVETSHFYVLPNVAEMDTMEFDGFSMGELKMGVLISRCNRASSNYATLYAARLKGRMALQSPDFQRVVIDFLTPASNAGLMANSAWKDLLLNYFELLSRKHFERMWAELERTQLFSAPFRSHIIDVENLKDDCAGFATSVTVYLEVMRNGPGYVVPSEGSFILNQPGADSEVFRRFTQHREQYRVCEIGDSELGRALAEVSGFCQQANRMLNEDRHNDAALYATICLEHLFSEKQATTKAVSSRTACLTHLRLAPSYAEAKEELLKLYDARSKFVHAGKPVSRVQAERLIEYAREAIRSLLVLHLKSENRKQGFLEQWTKELDFIIHGFEAGKSFESSLLADVGIFRS